MIDAKLVDLSGHVTTLQLSDDPSDVELIKALGGGADLITRAAVGDWEALRIVGTDGPTLVVGANPYLHAAIKRRRTCQLSDAKINSLVSFIDHWL